MRMMKCKTFIFSSILLTSFKSYPFSKWRLKTITSAPSLIELVLKPFPSIMLHISKFIWKQKKNFRMKSITSLHCPIDDFDFLSENPKLIQHLIASGPIPPPLSNWNMSWRTQDLDKIFIKKFKMRQKIKS